METYKDILIETRDSARKMLVNISDDKILRIQYTIIVWNLSRMIDVLNAKDNAVKHIRRAMGRNKTRG
ncbi:MAG: hypothetical protein IJX89_03055 [Alphaproteobacteria bacterium]|nr:hypothetical protein [Alphaproteobacteria bacterium]